MKKLLVLVFGMAVLASPVFAEKQGGQHGGQFRGGYLITGEEFLIRANRLGERESTCR